MFPQRKSNRRCVMVCLIEKLVWSGIGVGARMRRSKGNRSHQKTSAQLKSVTWRMLAISSLSILLNRLLLLPERKRLQFDLKCGGS